METGGKEQDRSGKGSKQTMASKQRLVRLACRDGHSHWAEPEMRVLPDGRVTLAIACDFGDVPLVHYVMRDAAGKASWRNTVSYFATLAEAEAARDELAAQQDQD